MTAFRRTVLFLLLLTVPFQAALGATRLLCAAGAHHTQETATAPHGHDAATPGGHHHEADVSDSHDHSMAAPISHESHGASGKCKTCSECCSAVAPISASQPTLFPPDIPLRVSSIFEPDIVSRTGDGLFRPPRTTSV